MIEIDGSYGEGGGQVLRTALSLSCLTSKPFRIFNIRRGRKKPGLMPQHLVSVRAAQLISGAEVTGDEKGAMELFFTPRGVRGGDFSFDIGTAGSTPLVLQTILPPLLFAGRTSRVALTGGTHVPSSPSFHYLAEVFAPALGRIGGEVRLAIESYGFYPRGGGRIRAEVGPVREIRPLRALERGRVFEVRGISAVGNLPLSIAERQREAALERIRGRIPHFEGLVDIRLLSVPTPGQGTFLFLKTTAEHAVAGFTSLGERGKRAETVGAEGAEEFFRYHAADGALDSHLADQIVLYLALTDEESQFTTTAITLHLLTNLWVMRLFRDVRIGIEGEPGEPGRVTVAPSPRPAQILPGCSR